MSFRGVRPERVRTGGRNGYLPVAYGVRSVDPFAGESRVNSPFLLTWHNYAIRTVPAVRRREKRPRGGMVATLLVPSRQ